MNTLIRNKILIFLFYLLGNVLLSFLLFAVEDYHTVCLIVFFVTTIVGVIVYLFDLYHALKIEIYFFAVAVSFFASYEIYRVAAGALHINPYFAFVFAFAIGVSLNLIGIRLKVYNFLTDKLYAFLDSKTNQTEKESEIGYRMYRKYALQEWFLSHPNCILNKTSVGFIVRVFFFILISGVAIYGLLGRRFLLSATDMVFNRIAFTFLLIYGIVYLIAGFRFSAKPAFVSWAAVLLLYSAHLFCYRQFVQYRQHIFLMHTIFWGLGFLLILFFLHWVKSEYFYNNLQTYERNGECITVDLFLESFRPIASLDLLLSFAVQNQDIKAKGFVQILGQVLNQSRRNNSVFCGYVLDAHSQCVTFYFYTEQKYRTKFEKAIRETLSRMGHFMSDFVEEEDPKWDFYENTLYPETKELCGIVSRNYMEELFLRGIAFDHEYEMGFVVNFKDKSDLVAFEESIKYFGFSLAYASFDEEESTHVDYRYYGEYKIRSYISPRRIDYLNELLLSRADAFGALYVGEWQLYE